MKRLIPLISLAGIVLLTGFAMSAPSDSSTRSHIIINRASPSVGIDENTVNGGIGTVIHPQSNTSTSAQTGKQAHTNVEYYLPAAGLPAPDETPPFAGYSYETPASLACIYNLVASPVAGCNPNNVSITNPTGGSQTIAIVDAYDDPYAAEDLAWFSLNFNIPFTPSQFQVVYANGFRPPTTLDGGWELEESLDIEYAHAMAPSAKVFLVEAYSNSFGDIAEAINVATNLVLCGKTKGCPVGSTGKGEVSMSFGGREFPGETLSGAATTVATDGTSWYASDGIFTTNNSQFTGGAPGSTGNAISGVVYFAASGDFPGTSWPCTSPYVVCVGGTSTSRSLATGNFQGEYTWADGGEGVSAFEPFPSYQSGVVHIGETTKRAVPDVASDANPFNGVWIYDSYPLAFSCDIGECSFYGWAVVGGTSVAAPTWSGIINKVGSFAASSTAELTTLYANRTNTADFNDVTIGSCGVYSTYTATSGWDFCTGIGSPKTTAGK